MELIKFNNTKVELPVKVLLSMEAIYEEMERYAKDKNHPYSESSSTVLKQMNQYPELRTGLEDLSQLEKYEDILEILFKPLFPDLLLDNEIKMVTLPFKYIGFFPTRRLSNILKNAGPAYEFNMQGFNIEQSYIYACSFILAVHYGRPILTANRPVYIEIPNKQTGEMRHYRVLMNGDFFRIEKTDKALDLTDEDIDELVRNGDDIALWKEKFPPNSFILKGFGIMNLFDNTQDKLISNTRSLFLRKDETVFDDFQQNIQQIFGIKDLQVGISVYNTCEHKVVGSFFNKASKSLLFKNGEVIDYRTIFCEGFSACVIESSRTLAIADIEIYGKNTNKNPFYRRLKQAGFKSILLVPIKIKGEHLQVIEIASYRKNELNALTADRLEDITPFVKIASERYFEESENEIESTIQENYTSIHPTVKWKFVEAAAKFNAQKRSGIEAPVLEDIVFQDIYPLYGQSDIVASSKARNNAIQADLEMQLSLVIETFEKVMKLQNFPIYKELIYRIEACLTNVRKGLKAGDEVGILDFLQKEIYPVFNHVETLSPELKKAVKDYISQIDPDLKVVYRQRKAYEDSVTMLNEKLAGFLDRQQEEAQQMFPHYFERYKTDGVEYNMYIGDSLVNNRQFNKVYLHNLRLWQLQTMCQIEQVAYDLVEEMPYPLRVASLLLVHSNSLAIKFRMDEKQFDVDGAYNVRYEIVKKRIDKSYIKGTTERLTQAGKIAIVYSNDSDATEYLNYLKFLQAENRIGKIEMLELQDLQGVSGLRAIRVEVIYKNKKRVKKTRKAEKTVEEMVADLKIVETVG